MKQPRICVLLPFLKKNSWPRIGKIAGESRYGFSEDDDLIEHALDELLAAHGAKDGAALLEALEALIHFIQSKEGAHGDASESA